MKCVMRIVMALLLGPMIAGCDKPKSSSDEDKPKGTGLPSIMVVGAPLEPEMKDAVTFENWRISGLMLYGVMTWDGAKQISAIGYTVKKHGVVVDQGDLSIPGGEFRKNQPIEVSLPITDDEPSKLIVILAISG